VPARTALEIVKKIHADTAALAEPAVKSRFEPLGVDARSSTPQELAARMQTETELWGPVIKAVGIKAE
jgi:tripartite-type tricarboxylate transporter receptor subunit TctC